MLSATAVLLLVMHFSVLTIYCLSPPNSKSAFFSGRYVYPFFHQTWQLFVPAPRANYKIYISDKNGKAFDVFSDLIHRHRQFRLAGRGLVLLTFVNSIHYFEKNSPHQAPLNGPVKDDLYFDMLHFSLQNYCKHQLKGFNAQRFTLLVQNGEHWRIYFN